MSWRWGLCGDYVVIGFTELGAGDDVYPGHRSTLRVRTCFRRGVPGTGVPLFTRHNAIDIRLGRVVADRFRRLAAHLRRRSLLETKHQTRSRRRYPYCCRLVGLLAASSAKIRWAWSSSGLFSFSGARCATTRRKFESTVWAAPQHGQTTANSDDSLTIPPILRTPREPGPTQEQLSIWAVDAFGPAALVS